jgi:hypothetical protein
MLPTGAMIKYFGGRIAQEDALRSAERTNPKQPIVTPSFVEPNSVGARYLSWDLSKNAASDGLDARAMLANLEARNPSIDRLVETLSKSAKPSKGELHPKGGSGLSFDALYGSKEVAVGASHTTLPRYGVSNATILGSNGGSYGPDSPGSYIGPATRRGSYGPN